MANEKPINAVLISTNTYDEDGFSVVGIMVNGIDLSGMCSAISFTVEAEKKRPTVTLTLAPDVLTIEGQADVVATRETYLRFPKP